MIPKILKTKLKRCFNIIGAKENLGGDLAVSEWNIKDVKSNVSQSYMNYEISTEILLNNKDVEIKINNSNKFMNTIKQEFVVKEMNFEKINTKRIKLNMILLQAISICD